MTIRKRKHQHDLGVKFERSVDRPPGHACDNCGDTGVELTSTRAGRLCLRCAASWLSRGVLPPTRRRGWPFDAPPEQDDSSGDPWQREVNP